MPCLIHFCPKLHTKIIHTKNRNKSNDIIFCLKKYPLLEFHSNRTQNYIEFNIQLSKKKNQHTSFPAKAKTQARVPDQF